MIVNPLAGKSLALYGDGMQIRDWLYVKYHCSAIRRLLEAGRFHQPSGFVFLHVHGFLRPEHERSLFWCYSNIVVNWSMLDALKLAAKDAAGKVLDKSVAYA